MKHEEKTPSQSLLSELCCSLHIDGSTRNMAELLLSEFKERDESWEESKSRSTVRCALFVAHKALSQRPSEKDKLSSLSLSSLLRGPSPLDLQSFMFKLKTFRDSVSLDEGTSGHIQRIINSFAFSLTFFNKYEELWEKTPLRQSEYKEFGWYIFILARINLLQRRSDVVECACMLLGTLHFLQVNSTPHIDSEENLAKLAALLKANLEQVRVSASHLALMMEELKKHNIIRGEIPNSNNLAGILDPNHLSHNTHSLLIQYERRLLPEDIDEREFFCKEAPLRAGVFNHRFSYQRIANYVEDEQLTINSKFHDIQFPSVLSNSPCSIKAFTPPTPMSTATEMYAWLNLSIGEVEDGIPTQLAERLEPEALAVLKELLRTFEENLAPHLGKLTGKDSLLDEPSDKLNTTFKLFCKVLLEMIRNDDRQQEIRADTRDNLSLVLKQETFYRALMACCLETMLFIHTTTALEFEEVLNLCGVSAFDAWKLMKNFIEFDPKVPKHLWQYFKGLENRVICHMAWTEESSIPQLFRQHLSTNTEVTHPALLMFCRRVLSHCAGRILELSNMLGLNDNIKEEIWTVMKFSLSSHTDLFVGRHLDQLVICSIYGVCKAMNLNVTFNSLIVKYSECYNDPGSLFRHVKIDENTPAGDIISFYNKVYIKHARNVLLEINKNAPPVMNQPRISAFNPSSPLTSNLPGPMLSYTVSPEKTYPSPSKSPLLTPISKGHYCFGESPSSNLEDINRMMRESQSPLNLDDDIPRKRGIEEILNDEENFSDFNQ